MTPVPPVLPVPGLLVTHGALARALAETAALVGSPPGNLELLTNDGKGTEQLAAEIGARLDQLAAPTLLLVDLAGGSCDNAARIATRERPGHRIICGINLPMLLDYLQKRDRMAIDELAGHVADRARIGVVLRDGGAR